MKATEGPWHPTLTPTRALVSGDDHPICEVTMGDWGDTQPSFKIVNIPGHGMCAEPFVDILAYGHVQREEAIANLLLIASAKDLLDICERLVALVDIYTDNDELIELSNDAFDAIWKTKSFQAHREES